MSHTRCNKQAYYFSQHKAQFVNIGPYQVLTYRCGVGDMAGQRTIFFHRLYFRIRFRTYRIGAPHIVPQSDMRRRMRTHRTSTNGHILLPQNEIPTGCGGGLSGCFAPDSNTQPSYRVGSRTQPYSYRSTAAPYQGRPSGLLSHLRVLESGASQLRATPTAARSLAAWASAGFPTTRPRKIQQRAKTSRCISAAEHTTCTDEHVSYR